MPGGIRSDADFWRLLSERGIVQEPISERYGKGHLPIGEFSGPGRLASPYEGLIRDDEKLLFDRSFFGMSHNELRQTEPQVRMLLNCAWEAIEHVGWDLHSLRNSPTGVFIGSQVPAVSNWRPQHGVSEHTVSGISLAMLANRVSYYFNLMGSSATYCTACSAGLSALHAAMNALACGDCDQALVGAVTYLGSGRISSGFNLMGVISPDGTCRSFDAEANGYMRSEGSFVFAIKPLAAAERDGDPIHAVIEATAVNAAGAADGTAGLAPGRFISAPTRHSQAELMREASARAGRMPREFDYVEAHATGTAVGDPIEGNAIAQAFGGFERAVPLRVSSVKSNLGHMEAAAFHCALLKVVLMMQRRTFAPTSSNFQVPNPEIDFDSCPMQVQTECEPFPDHPVVVGINSFGFGGANGHCVVREYRPERPRLWSMPLAPDAGVMIPLSARTPKALVESAERLRRKLDEQPVKLYALAGNLSRRRTHFAARTSFVARSVPDLTEALGAFAEAEAPIATADEGERRLLMVFAGQGTQWAGCGHDLYEAHPVFRRAIDAIEEHWRERAGTSLREACFSAPQAELDEVQLAQPAIFMIQCALVELFKTWGVYPDCVVGHSSGEVAAAYACGALSLGDATRLVFRRATLQQRVAGSARMLAIGLDRPGVEDLLDGLDVPFRQGGDRPVQVEIACENAPANTVICGREDDLRPVMEALDGRNLQNRLIPGNIAFHSRAMDAIKDDAFDALSFLDDRAFDADVPFVSSVTGTQTERLDSAYWWSNIRQPVRFAAAMEMVDDPLLSRELSQACLDLLDRGVVPPLPVTVFPYGDYAKALRLMTSGQHQGKLVLKAPPASAAPDFPIDDRRPLLDPDATYLVTGGLGGFGQRLLPYLVTAGARHLTLMDRDPERRRSETWLRRSTTLADIGEGVEIDLVQGDVAEEADVRRCVADVKRPLKGVFHLAGALDDCMLADLSADSVARVFAPKARGALNLHRATAGLALDHFVMVSSTSSTFGNPGQINYSAANAYLDGLAACRRRQGLPALSYNLAAVADTGMAARNLGVLRLMKAAGMPPVSSHFAVANLDYALRTMGGSDHLITALFKRLLWSVGSTDYMRTGRLMSNQDAFAIGSDERLTVDGVMAQIAAKVAELCGHDEGGLEEPLSSFGLNSISVAELGAFIQSEFGFQASALELMTTASCQSLAHAIVLGRPTDDETDADDEDSGTEDAPLAAERRVRRKPSVFASAAEDHFPPTPCSEWGIPEIQAAE